MRDANKKRVTVNGERSPAKYWRTGVTGFLCTPYPASRTPHPVYSLGFTFVELMVVIVIIAILIIASMPMFRNFTRNRNLKEGANVIASALMRTRSAAITERERYKAVLDTLNHAVAIYKNNDVDNPAEYWKKLPEFVEFVDPATSSYWGVTNSYSAPSDYIYYLEFKPNGGLGGGVGAATENIAIIDTSTEDTKIIDVNGLTGRVRIEE